jgi:GTP-binding protein
MIVVAIDGPSGAGKSSTSKLVAKRAGWSYLDTGALYRAVTWLAITEKLTATEDILAALKRFPLRFVASPITPQIFVGDTEVTDEIRSEAVTQAVSAISAMPEIRAELLIIQRKFIAGAERGIVVEGRDIGTVVFPDAVLKVYLTASPRVRAERRVAEAGGDIDEIERSIAERDLKDSTRTDSPLQESADSVVVDTSNRSIEDIVGSIVQLVEERLK